MSTRELRHYPLELVVYACPGCAEQYWPGRDGLPRCQNTDMCGKPIRIVVRADEAMQQHLGRAKRLWEKTLHERMVAFDARASAAAEHTETE